MAASGFFSFPREQAFPVTPARGETRLVKPMARAAALAVVAVAGGPAMGGKLFNLPRMPRDAYIEVEAAMRRHLDSKLPGQYRIPRYYGDKPD
jgi:hypothetical protein